MRREVGPLVIVGALIFLGFSIFLITRGSLKLVNEKAVVGRVTGYTYTNYSCIICQSLLFPSGLPKCKEVPHSGALLLAFDNCLTSVAVNVCGETPKLAERHTKEVYSVDATLEGYAKDCEFQVFASDGWQFLGFGIAFFMLFVLLLCVGIYFARKYDHRNINRDSLNDYF